LETLVTVTIPPPEKNYRETRSSLSDDYRLQELLEEKAHAGQAETITAEKTAALTNLESTHNTDLEGVNTARNTMVEDLASKQNAEVDALNKARRLETVTIENDVNAMLTYLNNQRNTMVAQMRAQEQAIETEHLRRMKELIEQGQQQQQNDIIRAYSAQRQQIIADSLSQLTGAQAATGDTAAVIALNIGSNVYSGNSAPQQLANDIIAQSGRNYSKALQVADLLGGAQGWTAAQISALKVMIPKAAEGGVFDKPTIALIGEAGSERVTPLNKFNREPEARTIQPFVFSPTINLKVSPSASTNPKQLARELLDEMNILIRNEIKSKTFLTS